MQRVHSQTIVNDEQAESPILNNESEEILLSCKAKKRSYLILRPQRELVLYKNGTFAYYEESNSEKKLKLKLEASKILKVKQEGTQLNMVSPTKKYNFFFDTKEEAGKWAEHLEMTRKISSKSE